MTKQINPSSLTVNIAGKNIVLQKLPLGKYAELLQCMEELPKQFEKIDEVSTEQLLPALPKMIASALPEAIKILAIASPLTKEEIEALALDDATALLAAIFQVNRYDEVYKNIKKMFAQKTGK